MKGMTKMTNFLPVVAEASASGGNQSSMIFMILFYVAIFADIYSILIIHISKNKK